MDRASDAPVVASAGTQAEPRTPASWLLSAGRFQTAAPLPVGSDPRSVPRTEPVHIAPLPSSPALGRYAKGLPAAVILLRRNRTDRPLNEGFLLRRLHQSSPAGFSSSRMRALVIIPRSPTSTTRDKPKCSLSLSICVDSVIGSAVLPSNTSTATGQPSAAHNRP